MLNMHYWLLALGSFTNSIMSTMNEKKTVEATNPRTFVATDSGPPKDAKTIKEKYADATFRFVEQYSHSVEPLSAEGQRKLSRKLYLNVLLLVCVVNLMLFVRRAYSFQILQYKLLTNCRSTNQHSHTPVSWDYLKRLVSMTPNTIT